MVEKKLNVLLMAIVLSFAFLFGSIEVHAAKDVTGKLKNDKGIKWIVKNMAYYGAIEHERNNSTTNKKKKIKMNETNKVYLAAILSANKYGKYQESDSKIVNNNWLPSVDEDYVKVLYKKMYGSNVDMSKVKNKTDVFVKEGSKLYVIGGNFGTVTPKYSISTITRKKKGGYCIIADMKLKSDWDNTVETIGKMWITVKKDKKSYNGYIIKNISYRIK